jgi:hypothetical protein
VSAEETGNVASEPPQEADARSGAHEPPPSAAAEAELAAMTSTDMMFQAAVLLINIGGRRLDLVPPSASDEIKAMAAAERDLEQVRDAIDAVRALIGVLERTVSSELAPLRDALSQLQIAYAREVHGAGDPQQGREPGGEEPREKTSEAGGATGETASAGEQTGQRRPGPAESSGRLWVPGR